MFTTKKQVDQQIGVLRMAGDTLPSHIIHDDKCQKAGLTAKWVRNDQISVTAFQPVLSSSVDKPSKFISQEGTVIHHLQTNFIFEDAILTELVADSNFIFKSVQALKMSGSRSEYLKMSRSYRSIIRAYLEKLQEHIGFSGSDMDPSQYESLITTFYTIEFLWHLCEILIIDPTSTNMVVGQLIGWIRFHYPQSERMAGEFLVSGVDVDSHELYWDTVRGQIMQGQVEVARALLKLHTAADTVPFQVTEQILKTIPTYSTYGGLSVQKFRSQWQYWVMDTETKLPLVTVPELETIIRLTTGDVEAWNKQAASSESWYEFFPGFLFYSEPTCKYFELGTFANVWISRWAKVHGLGTDSGCKMRLVDQIALHIIENDLHQVLHEIQSINDNQWFVTHLTDLLYNCGQLEVLGEQQISLTSQLRDALVFDYGSTLLARDDVWVQGVEYLEQAADGRTALELCLSKVHLTDETVAEDVIRQCQMRNYPAVESEVCKVMARKALHEDMLGDALVWAIKSQNNLFVASVADIFLNTFRETGRMPCPEILENIGEKMFVSPRLVFLIKFFDFHQYYEREEFPQAAELLVNLLDSKITPEFFWPILLADTIPLLESADPKIPSRETVQIIHHLETQFLPILEREREYQKVHDKSRILHNTRLDDVEKLIKLIRGASARNLSRMLIIENTVAL